MTFFEAIELARKTGKNGQWLMRLQLQHQW